MYKKSFNIYDQEVDQNYDLPSLYSLKDEEEKEDQNPDQSLSLFKRIMDSHDIFSPSSPPTKSFPLSISNNSSNNENSNNVNNNSTTNESSIPLLPPPPLPKPSLTITHPSNITSNVSSSSLSSNITPTSSTNPSPNKLKRTYSKRISIFDNKNTLKRYSSITDQDYLNFIEKFDQENDSNSMLTTENKEESNNKINEEVNEEDLIMLIDETDGDSNDKEKEIEREKNIALDESIIYDELELEAVYNELYEESTKTMMTNDVNILNSTSSISAPSHTPSLSSPSLSIALENNSNFINKEDSNQLNNIKEEKSTVVPSFKKEIVQSLGMWYYDKKRKKKRYIGLNGIVYEGGPAVKQSKLDKARADHPARLLRLELINSMEASNSLLSFLVDEYSPLTNEISNEESTTEEIKTSTSTASSTTSASISSTSTNNLSEHRNAYPDPVYTSLSPISAWGIPSKILQNYSNIGVKSLFPWQIDCLLSNHGNILLDNLNSNLVYSAPTSGGKTLVAEILMLRKLAMNMKEMDKSLNTNGLQQDLNTNNLNINRRKTIFYVVPFISLAEEKFNYFQTIWSELNLGIKAYHKDDGTDNSLGEDVELVICTIERANILLNNLLDEKRENQLSMIVIDEIHLLSDPSRGFLLEVMLSKIKFLLNHTVQIIGMSATLPNIKDLAHWLEASLFVTNYRPVSLDILICHKKLIYKPKISPKEENSDNNISKLTCFDNSMKFGNITFEYERKIRDVDNDYDGFKGLCVESLLKQESLLVFCNTKRRCEVSALAIVESFRNAANIATSLHPEMNEIIPRKILRGSSSNSYNNTFGSLFENTEQQILVKRNLLIDKLSTTLVGLCPTLKVTIPYGVAYHHAGLTHDERKLIEDGYREGYILLLCTTSTLSAGVNLPAKRVLILNLITRNAPVSVSSFRQMSGRAGRLGQGTGKGEAIIILSNSLPLNERKVCENLLVGDIEPLKSNLHNGYGGGLEKLLLEMITTNRLKHEKDVVSFIKCTLMWFQHNSNDILNYLKEAVIFLKKEQFVLTSTNGSLTPSPLGKATMLSGIPPKDSKEVLQSLIQARSQLILKGGLHPLYLLTPTSNNTIEPDWDNYQKLLDILYKEYPEAEQVANVIGIKKEVVNNFLYLIKPTMKTDPEAYKLYKRFYNSIILFTLTQEWPMARVLSFVSSINRGQLQQLQKDASTFCGMITLFCYKLNWKSLAAALKDFQPRLFFGTYNTELLPLVRIGSEIVTTSRAKVLFEHGIKTPQELIRCDQYQIAKWLEAALPYYDRTVLNYTTNSGGTSTTNADLSKERGWQSCLRIAQRILLRYIVNYFLLFFIILIYYLLKKNFFFL